VQIELTFYEINYKEEERSFMEKQIVECRPMKQIGFDVGGHSQYDDLVWATLNEIADQYGLFDAKVIVGSYTSNKKEIRQNYGFDHWLLLPTMLVAGAIIIGEEESGDRCHSYSVYLRHDDTVEAFCERMRKIEQFY
jgi:hypothetical protein